MDTFIIQGGRKLAGEIQVKGAKNSATPILAATVLIEGDCVLHNVPRISDVEMMLDILKSMGARVSWVKPDSVSVNCAKLDPSKIDAGLVGKIRSSILLIGCLAHRFGTITMSVPGGCTIGSRPLDAHFDALTALGYRCESNDDTFTVEKKGEAGGTLVMSEFSVTATENAILASVLVPHALTIKCAAAEHVVQDLCWFLQKAGASIQGIGTHELRIKGAPKLRGVEYHIMPDPIETGTFITLAAATHSAIAIQNAAPEFLTLEMKKFADCGVSFSIEDMRPDPEKNYSLATLRPRKTQNLKAIKKIHTMPYPGFAADLIQPFALLMTQAQGITLLHDWMFDGRLRYVSELQKMGANITILDPHRILIVGPTPLYGKEITSFDLRAGATLVVAALIAEGTSVLRDIHQVDRGYQELDKRLQLLGASIERQ